MKKLAIALTLLALSTVLLPSCSEDIINPDEDGIRRRIAATRSNVD